MIEAKDITIDFIKKRPLSFSSLKEFVKSPQHYLVYLNKIKEPTDDMIIGSLCHKLLLEPEDFGNEFLVEPDGIDRRTKEGKEKYAAALIEAEDKKLTLVSGSLYSRAQQVVSAFIHHPNYAYIKRLIKREQKFEIVHTHTGLPLTGYIDGEDDVFNVELKFVKSAEESEVIREFYNMKYHLQNAIYNLSNGKKTLYVAVEKTAPYCSRAFIAGDDYTQAGHKELERTMSNFKYCLETSSFDLGYEFHHGFEPAVLQLPAWAKKEGADG